MDLWDMTIHQLARMLERGEVTSQEVTASIFQRIKSVEEKVRAYLTLTEDEAMRQAAEADELIRRGGAPPLAGIPLAIKDVICTKGVRTTCGSRILENFVPPYDATVMELLKKEKVVVIGKTNMDEFAMGSSTENSAFGPTHNPWDLERVPGGSSGGSAAAVAAGECIAALGSDTGGSIRQPAALCGIVGMKPTYGRVSRFGLVAFASSLDQIGPMTKDVEDCAVLMNAICAYDPRDSTSVPRETPDYTRALNQEIKDVRIGVPREYFPQGIDAEVEMAVKEAIRVLEDLGGRAVDVSLPYTDYGVSAYYIIAPSEASSNLARYDGVRYGYRARGDDGLVEMYKRTRSEGFGPEVTRRIMLGTFALSAGYYEAYYGKACQARTLMIKDFGEAFKKCDVLVTPTSPTGAFRLGEKVDDPLQMYLSDIFTIPVNLAGLPAISIPCGFTKDGLPVGLQIIGRHFDEETVIRVAHAFERATEFHKARPALS